MSEQERPLTFDGADRLSDEELLAKIVADASGDQPEDPVHAMAELLRNVGAAVSGYRKQLIEAGWSEAIAEQIAAQALLSWQHRLLGGCK